MPQLWIAFWAVAIFGSIAWYGFLLFYIGVKAGREIGQMTRNLGSRTALGKANE